MAIYTSRGLTAEGEFHSLQMNAVICIQTSIQHHYVHHLICRGGIRIGQTARLNDTDVHICSNCSFRIWWLHSHSNAIRLSAHSFCQWWVRWRACMFLIMSRDRASLLNIAHQSWKKLEPVLDVRAIRWKLRREQEPSNWMLFSHWGKFLRMSKDDT